MVWSLAGGLGAGDGRGEGVIKTSWALWRRGMGVRQAAMRRLSIHALDWYSTRERGVLHHERSLVMHCLGLLQVFGRELA